MTGFLQEMLSIGTQVNDGLISSSRITGLIMNTEIVGLPASQISGLAPVATTGNYGDLSGTPSLATVATSGNYGDLSGTPSLATVATSGNYGDLSGIPILATVATGGALDGSLITGVNLPASQITGLYPTWAIDAAAYTGCTGGSLVSGAEIAYSSGAAMSLQDLNYAEGVCFAKCYFSGESIVDSMTGAAGCIANFIVYS